MVTIRTRCVTAFAFRTTSVRAFSFQTQSVMAYVYQTQSVKAFAFVVLPHTPSRQRMSVHMPLPTQYGHAYAYSTKMGTALAFRATSVKG
jgi:hypothetical protein